MQKQIKLPLSAEYDKVMKNKRKIKGQGTKQRIF